MFSEPVYTADGVGISYITKNTCDKSLIEPMYELVLYTPCNVYPLLVLFKISSKP